MIKFSILQEKMMQHFNKMTCKENYSLGHLFEVEIDKDEMWNLYLDSFPAGTNNLFRERREYDCSCCRQFVRAIGNTVVIKDNKVETIWDFETGDSDTQQVVDALANYIKARPVTNIYVSKFKNIGTKQNREQLPDGTVRTWDHWYLELPDRFVNTSSRSEGDIKGDYRDTRNVFKRSLDEITRDAVETILELIAQNSLYKGEEWKKTLNDFLKYKKEYEKLPEEDKGNYAWEKSLTAGIAVGRIRNHSMGTLLVDISEGVDLETAVKKYEKIVAPDNYKRPKAIFTKKMLEEAQKTITDLGYLGSLPRRFAKLDDITVNNILFSNKDSAKRISGALDIFAEMEREATSKPKHFNKVEEVPVDKFIKDILPTAKELELYLESKHEQNMVSLIAPVNKDAQTMFKWSNNFGWAYSGNVTDSLLKERVKAAGGDVNGVLRYSIQWNDRDEHDRNDLDAHCIEPNGHEIAYFDKFDRETSGKLDVDIQHPAKGVPAVENITWENKRSMIPGTYKFFVNNFAHRGGRGGFRAEIEFDGQIFTYDYSQDVRKDVVVALVTLHEDGSFTIEHKLPAGVSNKDIWGVKANDFAPVSVVCYSPNYWDDQNGIGHRHVFFMLKDCVNPEQPNGFFNEYLKPELEKHKRVFEALGSKMKVEDCDDQLSGVGFSTTKRGEVVLKVKGSTERIIKVKF